MFIRDLVLPRRPDVREEEVEGLHARAAEEQRGHREARAAKHEHARLGQQQELRDSVQHTRAARGGRPGRGGLAKSSVNFTVHSTKIDIAKPHGNLFLILYVFLLISIFVVRRREIRCSPFLPEIP